MEDKSPRFHVKSSLKVNTKWTKQNMIMCQIIQPASLSPPAESTGLLYKHSGDGLKMFGIKSRKAL